MATVEVVSAKTSLPEDPNEASLKAQETTEEGVKTLTAPGPVSEQPKEEESADPEVNDSVVETREVVEEDKVVTVTEEDTQKEAAETPVVEEIKDNADDPAAEVQAPAAAGLNTEVQKEEIVQEEEKVVEAEAKGKVKTETLADEKKDDDGAVDREASAEKSEEKVDIEASDEKSEEKVSIEAAEAEKSEDGTEAPTERTE